MFWAEGEVVDPDDPDMAALLALQEELTAEERAEAFKERGNEALRRGQPVNLRHAVDFYTQALDAGCDSNSANSVFYANRAQANLLLSNWGRALSDGRAALVLDPRNLKACFRAAKAAATLGRHAEAAELCAEGLRGESHCRTVSPPSLTLRPSGRCTRRVAATARLFRCGCRLGCRAQRESERCGAGGGCGG